MVLGRISLRVVRNSFLSNLLLALGKAAAAILIPSPLLLATAIHSGADAVSQLLLLIGIRRGTRESNELRPFSLQLDCCFWAFILSIVIFTAGAVYAITRGIARLHRPAPQEQVAEAVVILALCLLLALFLLRQAYFKVKREMGHRNLFAHLHRTKHSVLAALFIELLASAAGLLIALGLFLARHLAGVELLDGLGSIAIGALLAAVALLLGMETRHLLIDESANPELMRQVYDFLRGEENVQGVIRLSSLQLGPGNVLLAARIQFDPRLTTIHIATQISGIESEIRVRHPEVKKVFIEPDQGDATRRPPLA